MPTVMQGFNIQCRFVDEAEVIHSHPESLFRFLDGGEDKLMSLWKSGS